MAKNKNVANIFKKKNLKSITAVHQVVNHMKIEKKMKKKNEINIDVGIE
jgi:hypothetical protein